MPGGAARIRLTADGRALVQMASHEMGMGTATVQKQHVAERLGLEFENVTFDYGDTSLPSGTLAGGSSQTASIGAAIIAATDALTKELLKLAGNDSPLAGLKPEEVEARDGGLCKFDEPDRWESYVSILQRAKRDEVVCKADAPMPLEVQKYSMHSYGAQFCEVRVVPSPARPAYPASWDHSILAGFSMPNWRQASSRAASSWVWVSH
jgi:xanthine dehydrogenase YagR molybdenum-binding subunit